MAQDVSGIAEGYQRTPDQIRMDQEMAKYLVGADPKQSHNPMFDKIRSPWQGISNMANALVSARLASLAGQQSQLKNKLEGGVLTSGAPSGPIPGVAPVPFTGGGTGPAAPGLGPQTNLFPGLTAPAPTNFG